MRYLAYILLIFSLSGCTMNKYFWDVTKPGLPSMKWMYDGPPPRKEGEPPYDPLYVDGWRDGCETGVSGNTNAFYKYLHGFKQDWQKAQNEIYYKGWKDAYSYCGRYIYKYNAIIGL